jgi:hypothetical protein
MPDGPDKVLMSSDNKVLMSSDNKVLLQVGGCQPTPCCLAPGGLGVSYDFNLQPYWWPCDAYFSLSDDGTYWQADSGYFANQREWSEAGCTGENLGGGGYGLPVFLKKMSDDNWHMIAARQNWLFFFASMTQEELCAHLADETPVDNQLVTCEDSPLSSEDLEFLGSVEPDFNGDPHLTAGKMGQIIPHLSIAATLNCAFISAGSNKCGVVELCTPSTPPKIYTVRRKTHSGSGTMTVAGMNVCYPTTGDQTWNFTVDADFTRTWDKNVPCGTPVDTGYCHMDQYFPNGTHDSWTDPNCELYFQNMGREFLPLALFIFCDCGSCSKSCDSYNDPGIVCDSPTHRHRHQDYCESCSTSNAGCTACGCSSSGSYDGTQDLSNEYTTTELIDNVVAALPDYGTLTPGFCMAQRNMAPNETSYYIQRFKYKFTLDEAVDTDVIVHWNEVERLDFGGGTTTTPMSATIAAGDTETAEYEVTEPAANGYTQVEDITSGIC